VTFRSPKHLLGWVADFFNNTEQGKARGPRTSKEQEQFDLWMQHKIICVDVARSDHKLLNNSETYVCMEDLQSGCMSTHYAASTITWEDAEGIPFRPKIVVSANDQPRHDKLSTNRLQVHILDPDTFDLKKDLDFDHKLEIQKQKWAEKGAAIRGRIAAIEAGEVDEVMGDKPTVEVKTPFEKCYVLAIGKTTKISAKTEMLETLKRAGYRGDLKQMNKWIRETYGPFEQISPTQFKSTTSNVVEKKPGGHPEWYGFVLTPHGKSLSAPPAGSSTSESAPPAGSSTSAGSAPSAGFSWKAPVAL
jgi:hypothetical protein